MLNNYWWDAWFCCISIYATRLLKIKNINWVISFMPIYFLKNIPKMYKFFFCLQFFHFFFLWWWGVEIVQWKLWVIFDVEKKASPCKEAIQRISNENKINHLILGSQHHSSWGHRISSQSSINESVSLKNKSHLLHETVYSLSKGCVKVFNKSCSVQARDKRAQLSEVKYIRHTRKT